jgi:hypothetical protein
VKAGPVQGAHILDVVISKRISTKCSGDGDTRFFFLDVLKICYNSEESLSATSVDENLKIVNIWSK